MKNDVMSMPAINLDLFKDGIREKFSFVSEAEKDIFNWEEISKKPELVKIEYYKLAKSSLMGDLNFIKTLPLNSNDEMLKNIIMSLNKEQKEELKKFLVKLISKRKEIDDE